MGGVRRCEKIFWFGTSNGLVKAIRKDTSRVVTSYSSIEDAFSSFEIIQFKNVRPQISTIVEDDEHQLWLGIQGGGVVRFNAENNTFKQYVPSATDTNSITTNSILSLRKNSTGEIWICTFNGISVFNIKKIHFGIFMNPAMILQC